MAIRTVFLHAVSDGYLVAVRGQEEGLLNGRLEVKDTDAGPRPARFSVHDGPDQNLRSPDEFVELARRANRIRISEQTPALRRRELRHLFDGYQLGGKVKAVRTCRRCATAGRYSPLTEDTAIEANDERVCRDCAVRALERETDYRGLGPGARTRLEELLVEVGDLDRITALLSGELDPTVTKFDEISATVDQVEPVRVADLDLHPEARSILAERFDELLPVQSLGVEHGVLQGRDQLVVSATATGKTLIGELAGLDRILRGKGKMLFLVPLVALANQKYELFQARYGRQAGESADAPHGSDSSASAGIAEVSIRVGASRIRDESHPFDPSADIIVGTYEGIDHALRTGRDIGNVGTVVIDEVHNIGEGERGHRLDGLITRLKHSCRDMDTQWVYLSATVGNPTALARALDARLIEFEDRPVPIERHVTFANGHEKPAITDRLVKRAFDRTSSKGYRGQTIVFTNSRRRCHEISRRLTYDSAAYHAGLDYSRRKQVERSFSDQELAAVVTTAALAAGVDFPASQVVFDSLAMGIEWLTVQEFEQMLGRAGRPDFHDQGRVYLLVEPDGRYHSGQDRTEDEVAFTLLKGEMEPVSTVYEEAAAASETLANVVVAGSGAKALNDRMVGEIDTKRALATLIEYGFIDGLAPTDLGRAVTEHFLAPDRAFLLLDGIRRSTDPDGLIAAMELSEEQS